MTEISIQAVPLNDTDHPQEIALECSACGPVGIVHPVDTAEQIAEHFTEHGCDLDQIAVTKEEHERREG